MSTNERKSIIIPVYDVEEAADVEIEDVPDTIDSSGNIDVPDDAEEDDTIENVGAFDEQWDGTNRPNAIIRLVRAIRRKMEKTRVANRARSLQTKERMESSPLYQRMKATTRWHWICGAIVCLSIYDLTLFFFGDKSYDIIFPKAEPIEGAYTEEKPRLVVPDVEEYEAKKPDLDKAERESDDELGLNLAPNEREDIMDEMPTSVTTEVVPAAKDIPTSSEIKAPAPKIEMPAPPPAE